MIFPDLPRSRKFTQAPVMIPEVESITQSLPITKAALSADEWFAQHFPDQATPVQIHREPFDWRQDKVGVLKLFVFATFMVCWTWYWHQFQ